MVFMNLASSSLPLLPTYTAGLAMCPPYRALGDQHGIRAYWEVATAMSCEAALSLAASNPMVLPDTGDDRSHYPDHCSNALIDHETNSAPANFTRARGTRVFERYSV